MSGGGCRVGRDRKKKKTPLPTSSSSKALTMSFLCFPPLSVEFLSICWDAHKPQLWSSHPVGGASAFVSTQFNGDRPSGYSSSPKNTDWGPLTLRMGKEAFKNIQGQTGKLLDTCRCSKQPTNNLISCFSNTRGIQFQVSSFSNWCHYRRVWDSCSQAWLQVGITWVFKKKKILPPGFQPQQFWLNWLGATSLEFYNFPGL